MKMGTAYKRPDGWYFHANSKTNVGVSISWPPYIRLDINATHETLGQAVLEALNGTEYDVPHPRQSDWVDIFRPMLNLAGVRTSTQFAKDASCVGLSADDRYLSIEPWKNAGSKGGFAMIENMSVKIPLESSPAEIGEALTKAMRIAEAGSLA